MQKLTKGEIRVLMILFIATFLIGATVGFVVGTSYTLKESKDFIINTAELDDNKFQIGNNIYEINKVSSNSFFNLTKSDIISNTED